jgi:hypothetical protein
MGLRMRCLGVWLMRFLERMLEFGFGAVGLSTFSVVLLLYTHRPSYCSYCVTCGVGIMTLVYDGM